MGYVTQSNYKGGVIVGFPITAAFDSQEHSYNSFNSRISYLVTICTEYPGVFRGYIQDDSCFLFRHTGRKERRHRPRQNMKGEAHGQNN